MTIMTSWRLLKEAVKIAALSFFFITTHDIHAQVGGRMGGGEIFPQGKIFENFFGGGKVFLPPKKIFPTPFFVKFDEILVYLDAKT